MVILLAVVALVVVNALKDSPWGAFTLAMTIPIAILMGLYLRFLRPGRVLEASAIGFVLVMFAVVARTVGRPVARRGRRSSRSAARRSRSCVIVYGFAASRAAGLAAARAARLPQHLRQGGRRAGARRRDPAACGRRSRCRRSPASSTAAGPSSPARSSRSASSRSPAAPSSGFHALISSGTTPKLLMREAARAARRLRLDADGVVRRRHGDGRGLRARSPASTSRSTARRASSAPRRSRRRPRSRGWGFPLDPATMEQLAQSVGEKTLLNRTGGAPSLARRHGAHLQRLDRRRAPARHLVPLRDHVRGAVHPHDARRRHARRPLHGPGARWARLRAAGRATGSWPSIARDERA